MQKKVWVKSHGEVSQQWSIPAVFIFKGQLKHGVHKGRFMDPAHIFQPGVHILYSPVSRSVANLEIFEWKIKTKVLPASQYTCFLQIWLLTILVYIVII